ncbi:MAG TPA: deaminase [Candidatus Saccharimonadales bacterium]|nr:deaminase [Candidatus Saccharimonadales bacterium]
MNAATTEFDWSELAFASKKPLRGLYATFVAAPRELSSARIKQIIKQYLPQGNLVFGISKEPYVAGFEDQPQFRMDDGAEIAHFAALTNKASAKHKVYTLRYFQRELPFVLEKLGFAKVLLVNGSWKHVFHSSPAYYVLANSQVPFEYISPFAQAAEGDVLERLALRENSQRYPVPSGDFTDKEMLGHAANVAKFSFDNTHQTGVVLGKKNGRKYAFMLGTFNKVVPTQSYALHHGAEREKHFSPPNDLNYYDTVHAEMELLVAVQKQQVPLQGTTMFINLLPCPTCARTLSQTDIAEFVYTEDHSSGYAIKMLEAAGKKVRRIVP